MEVKKSHKADLEHRRPYILAAAFVAVAVLFVGVMFIPFRSIGDLFDDAFDDFTMDLDIKANDQDDMIAAALPQEQTEKKEAEKLNKVDEPTELAPEQLEQTPTVEEQADSVEQKDEQPPINQNADDEETLKIVEQLPQYPGGMVEFMKWLTETLKYPDEALQHRIEGKVMVSFIVAKDGTLSDFKLVKRAHILLNTEALRVARLMPKWEPGKDKGKPCKTMVAIPIVFEL